VPARNDAMPEPLPDFVSEALVNATVSSLLSHDLPPDMERRVSIRHASDEEALCHLGGSPRYEAHWVRVRDVSTTGVGLLFSVPLPAGRRLSLEFPGAGPQVRRVVRARVMHCTAQGDETWLVGCRFDSPLADHELRELASQVD